jgi:hypothetical protein
MEKVALCAILYLALFERIMKRNLYLEKLSVSLIFLLFTYSAKAEILVDGIYYNIKNTNTVEVTCRGYGDNGSDGWMYFTADELYTNNVRVPSTITYNNLTYSVTAIGNDAFAGSKLLNTLILPSSVVTIGNGVFSLCNSLSSIQVEENNTVFFSENGILYKKNPVSLFYVPRNIQGDMELNSEITTIPSSAFQYCSGVTSVTIPANVTSIADGAFNSCTALTEINFSNTGKLATIGVQAFGKCSALMLINIPASVTTIEASAFINCNNLTYLLLNEGLKTIGKMAFYGCESISSVQLPSTLLSIGDKAFDLCENLATVINKTDFALQLKSETYGCVAKYATQIIKDDEVDLEAIKDSIAAIVPSGSQVYRYGYNELSETDQAMYDYILETLCRFDANKAAGSIYHRVDFDLEGQGFTTDLYSLMYMLIRIYRDVPEMYILNSIPRQDAGTGTYYGRIEAVHNPESYLNDLTQIETICNDIIANITDGMSTYEKLKVLHDGLIDWADYGGLASAYSGDIKGAFLERKAVCEGFSRAFLLLCQKVGIPCLYVSGSLSTNTVTDTWVNHAWNYVQVDGKWYLVDITTDGGFLGHTFYTGFLRGQDYFDTNYKLTTTTGNNENTDNGIYSVLPKLASTTYEEKLTGTFDIAENRNIKVWYHSTADQVFAEIKDFSSKDYVCEIYSLRGDLIEKQRIVNSLTQIDMSKVKGLFFVVITEKGGNLYTTKVLK